MLMITKQNQEKNNCHEYEYNRIELHQITYKTEELLEASENRFRITVKIAERAKRRKYEDIDIVDDYMNKPIVKAIIEMVDEITEPEILDD